MLPKILYEFLPYLYIVIGAGSGLFTTSTIILIASILFMISGVVVFVIRSRYRRRIRCTRQLIVDRQ